MSKNQRAAAPRLKAGHTPGPWVFTGMTVFSDSLIDHKRRERGHEIIAEHVRTNNGPLIAAAPAMADALEAWLAADGYSQDAAAEGARTALRAAGRIVADVLKAPKKDL